MTAWDSMVARGIYRDSTPFKVPFLLQPFFIFLSHAEMLLHRASFFFFFCLFLCPVSEHYGMDARIWRSNGHTDSVSLSYTHTEGLI